LTRAIAISSPIGETDREFVSALARGLSVIRAFGKGQPVMTVSEVAKAIDASRAVARRFLLTLQALGYVDSDGRSYRLSAKTLDLAYAYLDSHDWLSIVSPQLEKLKNDLGESVSLTVLDGPEVVYLLRFRSSRVMTLSIEVGSRRPAYATAMGRVLIGEMEDADARRIMDKSELRRHTPRTIVEKDALLEECHKAHVRGYAAVDQELEDGLVAVSVPLHNSRGALLAAVNVCGHISYLTIENLKTRCLPALRECARRISQTLI
jgi:IclR family transcriptional regulator, pca regulon regulatory protein